MSAPRPSRLSLKRKQPEISQPAATEGLVASNLSTGTRADVPSEVVIKPVSRGMSAVSPRDHITEPEVDMASMVYKNIDLLKYFCPIPLYDHEVYKYACKLMYVTPSGAGNAEDSRSTNFTERFRWHPNMSLNPYHPLCLFYDLNTKKYFYRLYDNNYVYRGLVYVHENQIFS